MNYKLGLDNGFNFTNTSKGVMFASTIETREHEDTINGDKVKQVRYNGKHYVVGEPQGQYIADADKLKTDLNREILEVCTVTAIAESFPTRKNINVDLVVGVPVAYYDLQKDEFKKLLLGIKDKIIKINGADTQKITIANCEVYPQSIGVVFRYSSKLQDKTSLIIDIGGGTWDVSQFRGMTLVKKETYQEGMIPLYEKIATEINNTNVLSNLKSYQIYDLMQKGTYVIDGISYDIKKVAVPIIKAHVKDVMDRIIRKFDVYNVDERFLIGGGAEELYDYIVGAGNYMNTATMEENAQFSNANNYELIAKVLFKDN